MKTILAFDFSLPTARTPVVLAVTEDGRPVSGASFNDETYPHRRYVIGAELEHASHVDDGLTLALLRTRVTVAADYDRLFGAGEWQVVWLADPRMDERFKAATRAQGERWVVKQNKAVDVLFEVILGALSEPRPAQTH